MAIFIGIDQRARDLIRSLNCDSTSTGVSNMPATRTDGFLVGEFRPLQNHSCFLKIQPRIAWVELRWVSVAQVAEKIDLPRAVRKEFRIQFVCVKTGHRSAV